MKVSTVDPGKAHVGLDGQHCNCCIHKLPGRFTLTSHVAICPSSHPMESEVATHIPEELNHTLEAMSWHVTLLGEWRLHPQVVQPVWS